jgi:hypothetical protein
MQKGATMKEAFEKIKECLKKNEEYNRKGKEEFRGTDGEVRFEAKENAYAHALSIVSEVEAEYMKNPMYQYAMVYAKDLVLFGVDVREHLDSAVAQSMALNQAYIKGVDDERKRIYEAEYGNGWIPCNRADHPYDGQRVLACINTRIATHEIIITDYNGEIYWFDGTISAWMPLPEPYKPGKGV